MSLFRLIYNALGWYFKQLFDHPIRTKSITSCVIATSANYTSQQIGGNKEVDQDSLIACRLFRLLFGGALPYYFYKYAERLLSPDVKGRKILQLLLKRLTYAPTYQVLSLYFLSSFEGKDPSTAYTNLCKWYWPILQSNWKCLLAFMFTNLAFVLPMLRVLIGNLIGFVWAIFVGLLRQKSLQRWQLKKRTTKSKTN